MRLLERPLPRMSLHPGVEASAFFDRCEQLVAESESIRIDRRRDYAGPGYDQLNLWLREQPDELVLRMVATPRKPHFVECDVVASWPGQPSYDEYVKRARDAFATLLRNYSGRFARRLTLGVERRASTWDWDSSTVKCAQVRYAHQKFHEAVRALAVGPGDSRARLRSAHLILHVVRADELPPPLRPHVEWVFRQLSRKEPRWKGDGTVDATLAAMKRETGARIAERIVEISEALDELCPTNRP